MMDLATPAISVIIPVYNVEEYISDCLDSVLAQTFSDFEVICINDASPDGSQRIVYEYIGKDSRIRSLQNSFNRGLSYSRNRGIEEARGKYIIFVDSDDVIRKDTLELTFTEAEKYDADIIYFDYNVKYVGGDVALTKPAGINYEGLSGVYKGEELFSRLENEHRFAVMACFRLYRKEFLINERLRFKEGILHEDFLFSFLCAMKAQRVACIPEELYLYIKREGAITARYTFSRLQSLYYVICSIVEYWKKNNLNERVSEAVGIYLDSLFGYCRPIIEKLGTDDVLSSGFDADRYLYRLFLLVRERQPEYIKITNAFKDSIKDCSNLYIYGAGNYGKELLHKLSDENIYVEAFLVSELDDPDSLCEGKRIIPLSKWEYDNDALIIIAMSQRRRDEVVKLLTEKGYNNYILLPEKEV